MKTNPGMQSIGAAMENMALEAVNLHYGSCWLTSANYAAAEIEALLKKRIGFEKEGYAKDYLLIDGQWRDHVLTALTTPDWTPGR